MLAVPGFQDVMSGDWQFANFHFSSRLEGLTLFPDPAAIELLGPDSLTCFFIFSIKCNTRSTDSIPPVWGHRSGLGRRVFFVYKV